MEDPRLKDMMAGKDMPFDGKRMIYGGFETLVDARRLIGAPRIAPAGSL